MKRRCFFENLKKVLLTALALPAFSVFAANKTETVTQVSGTVTLDEDVDYVITSITPFADDAILDITNTKNATVIFQNLKPSKALTYISHIRINGARAVKNSNCMFKIYADGCIVLPHGTGIKPLTVYSNPDFTGESAQFGVGTRQGLRNHALNNKIQSFTLKRGYMAWFATRDNTNDPGYNRIFIADKSDIKVELPAILCNSISALRVSQWNDASKKGYAGWDPAYNEPLNTSWCYSWDAGINIWDDREYVTHHHHEGWPGISDVGNNGTSAAILGNNEPDNTGDDREQVNSVAEVLATWPEMMATGRRLGSPAVAGNYAWLYEFMDSIDARGWRCDFVAVHAYWYSDWGSWQSQLSGIRNRTGRPIWITEMNYGANWTGWPGSDRSGSASNYAIELQHFGPVVDGLEATPWIERYAVYNWVEDCRMVIDGSMKLTPMGQHYANTKSKLAYSSVYNVVPKLPKMKAPNQFTIDYDKKTHTAVLQWKEYNGEYNKSMTVERQVDGQWEVVAQIDLKEKEAEYTFSDTEAYNGYRYLIHVVDANGVSHKTRPLQVVVDDMEVGDLFSVNGKQYYVGGNVIPNGDFDLGTAGWTNGEGKPLTADAFTVVPVGSIDGGAFLRAWTADNSSTSAKALKTIFDIQPNRDYYFTVAVRNDEFAMHRLSLSADGVAETQVVASLEIAPMWAAQGFTFNSGEYTKVIWGARRMEAKSVFDKFSLLPLFETREEAVADGVSAIRKRAELAQGYLAGYPELVVELQNVLATVNGVDEAAYLQLKDAVDQALEAAICKEDLPEWKAKVGQTVALGLNGSDEIQAALQLAEKAQTAGEYIQAVKNLSAMYDEYVPLVYAPECIQNPEFAETKGWETKVGTYKAGDQRLNTIAGKTCWSAWWSGISADKGKASTMEIRQNVTVPTHGLYFLECKATTQLGCLSDQHAYLVCGDDTVYSPKLTYDRMDISDLPDSMIWETLTTGAVYVQDDSLVTIGFASSKEGAVDGAWRNYTNPKSSDKREGWWCATDFALRFHPLYQRTVDASGWGAICLPYAFKPMPGVRLYQIAGLSADYQNLCLEEVTETEAGVSYIYYTTEEKVFFYEYGEAVARAQTVKFLRGNFISNIRVPAKNYALVGGTWQRMPTSASDRLYMTHYSAIIRSLDGIPVHQSWAGTMMPIVGADQEMADGIEGVLMDASEVDVYTIDGRRSTNQVTDKIYIEVKKDGTTRKVVR